MKRILGFALLAACTLSFFADSAEARRFGRRRCNTCATAYQSGGCAPSSVVYDQYGQDSNMGQPGYARPAQPNTTFYRGNPTTAPQAIDGEFAPQAPTANGDIRSNGTLRTPNGGIRANGNLQTPDGAVRGNGTLQTPAGAGRVNGNVQNPVNNLTN